MLLQTVEIVMADRARIKQRGKYCVSGSRGNVSCTNTSYSPGIDFSPTKNYCSLVLFDSVVSFNYSFERLTPRLQLTERRLNSTELINLNSN